MSSPKRLVVQSAVWKHENLFSGETKILHSGSQHLDEERTGLKVFEWFAILCPLLFHQVQSQHSISQEMCEHFMLISPDKLYGHAVHLFQQRHHCPQFKNYYQKVCMSLLCLISLTQNLSSATRCNSLPHHTDAVIHGKYVPTK